MIPINEIPVEFCSDYYSRSPFTLQLVTNKYVYYGLVDEGDENANTLMLDHDLNIISNNFFASDHLAGIVYGYNKDEAMLWTGKEFREWYEIAQEESKD